MLNEDWVTCLYEMIDDQNHVFRVSIRRTFMCFVTLQLDVIFHSGELLTLTLDTQ